MDLQTEIIGSVKEHLPGTIDIELTGGTVLEQLGMGSLELLTLILNLQKKYGFDIDVLTLEGIPVTIADLVALVSRTPGNS